MSRAASAVFAVTCFSRISSPARARVQVSQDTGRIDYLNILPFVRRQLIWPVSSGYPSQRLRFTSQARLASGFAVLSLCPGQPIQGLAPRRGVTRCEANGITYHHTAVCPAVRRFIGIGGPVPIAHRPTPRHNLVSRHRQRS